MLKGTNYQPKLLYPGAISFRHKGEISIFSHEGELRESVPRRPTLKEWLKEIL